MDTEVGEMFQCQNDKDATTAKSHYVCGIDGKQIAHVTGLSNVTSVLTSPFIFIKFSLAQESIDQITSQINHQNRLTAGKNASTCPP
jgi:hypothetical protein